MAAIKGVIFDLDGVICFTDNFHYRAWKAIADREHIYFDEKINNRLRGVSRMESLDIILEKAERIYSGEEKERLAEEKNEIYKGLLSEMSREDLSSAVKSTLYGLRGKGYLLAVGSSSKNTKQILERIGLGDFFDAVSDGTNIARSKPDPEVFIKAAQMLGLEPEECVVVEDAEAGIRAAHDGGFVSAGIGEAARSPLTDHPLGTIRELMEWLL